MADYLRRFVNPVLALLNCFLGYFDQVEESSFNRLFSKLNMLDFSIFANKNFAFSISVVY